MRKRRTGGRPGEIAVMLVAGFIALAPSTLAAPPTLPEPPPLIQPKLPRLVPAPALAVIDDRPRRAESSLDYRYRGVCEGHDVEIAWTQKRGRRAKPSGKSYDEYYALTSVDVSVDKIALDSESTEKLLRFLNNIAIRQSKNSLAKYGYYIVNGASAVCVRSSEELGLVFYYSDPVFRLTFGQASVSLNTLKAELTEGEGPDPLDGVPLDVNGDPDYARAVWGHWSDARAAP